MFDIAALVAKMETNIALIVDDVLAAPAVAGILAVFELLMHQRSAGFQRVFKREYRGQVHRTRPGSVPPRLRRCRDRVAATAATMSPT